MRMLLKALTAALLMSSVLLAQNPNVFDVASMKPTDPALVRTTPLRMDTLPGGRFVARNISLKVLIAYAYAVPDRDLSGAPSWFENTYDIDAVANGEGEMTAAQLRPFVVSLLEDRMKLVVHKEPREVTIYTLTVAPGGLKLKLSAVKAPPAFSWPQPTRMALRNATMPYIAGALSRHPDIHSQVIDKTGITGQFDLELNWQGITVAGASPGVDPPDSIFSIVQGLGMKLTPEKGSEDSLVIDHAERPSQN